jgi:hypothetical protein
MFLFPQSPPLSLDASSNPTRKVTILRLAPSDDDDLPTVEVETEAGRETDGGLGVISLFTGLKEIYYQEMW